MCIILRPTDQPACRVLIAISSIIPLIGYKSQQWTDTESEGGSSDQSNRQGEREDKKKGRKKEKGKTQPEADLINSRVRRRRARAQRNRLRRTYKAKSARNTEASKCLLRSGRKCGVRPSSCTAQVGNTTTARIQEKETYTLT